jgi:hypothetical protein
MENVTKYEYMTGELGRIFKGLFKHNLPTRHFLGWTEKNLRISCIRIAGSGCQWEKITFHHGARMLANTLRRSINNLPFRLWSGDRGEIDLTNQLTQHV